MPAKVANFSVSPIGALLLSGCLLPSSLLAGAVAGLGTVEYDWNTIQSVGLVLSVAAFPKVAGGLPYLPA